MELDRFTHYIGIDWATEAHRVCLLDHRGEILAKITIPHSGEGLHQLLAWLSDRNVTPARAAVAIEVPRGAIVETLAERRYSVFHLNPKQLDRFRDRYSVAGAKDDDRDAFVLANSLRTDPRLFHPVVPESAALIRLRELFRTAGDLRDELQSHGARCFEQLRRYYPQMLALSNGAAQPFLWDLIEAAPLPADAPNLSPERVQTILKTRQIRKFTAAQVLEILLRPALEVAPGTAEAASQHALLLIAQLRLTRQLREATLKQLRATLKEIHKAHADASRPSDVEIIRSLPGAGDLTVAGLLAESSQAIANRDGEALRTYSGVAPVTRRSGKSCQVVMRRAGNQRLRNVLHFATLASLRFDPVNRRHYDELRQTDRGHSCGRAVRGVADRTLSVLIAMLRHGTLYDPSRRKAWRATDAAPRPEFEEGQALDE
jgi:transposase